MQTIAACRIKVTGIVQGVGFRPFVFRLAEACQLNGWVFNSSQGVFIHVQGRPEQLTAFKQRLAEEAPPLALLRTLEASPATVEDLDGFIIRHSENDAQKTAMVPPDIAICADCRREVADKADRRFAYPFTNCTNCGPRFTIIKDIPYDRAMTTMAAFPMCPDCEREYNDPRRRRFHAQPNACPACGPHITLTDREGRPSTLNEALSLLKTGNILAVKGLGAFHLAANARDPEAVKKLRQRKQRDAKPFAVMARDLAAAQSCCLIGPAEEKWLTSPQAPIVILRERADSGLPADIIHPGLPTLGVMLPYTPLHFLLFDDELDVLIMTSANISDEPLITGNDEAREQLKGLADYFLLHDRDIHQPCDDSVLLVTGLNTPQFLRRARGFVPGGMALPFATPPLLALGGEMKSTFAFSRGHEIFLSQHWGDLNHYHNFVSFQQGLSRFRQLLAVDPELVVHDMHPGYQTSRWARQQSLPRLEVQHHHAHLAAAMADNALPQQEVLGLICDGSGYGSDGTVWGGELLKGSYGGFERLGHLRALPLPGGDITIRRPYRMAFVYSLAAAGAAAHEAHRLLPALSGEEADILEQQVRLGRQPLTSSCGRLFDAVGALLGISPVSLYEGQTAIELEAAADRYESGRYGWQVAEDGGGIIMDPLPLWEEMVAEIRAGRARGIVARKFHNTLTAMFAHALLKAREQSGLHKVVLSGGCWHNQLLLIQLTEALEAQDFEVFHHQQAPPGDGGLALGQAAIGAHRAQLGF